MSKLVELITLQNLAFYSIKFIVDMIFELNSNFKILITFHITKYVCNDKMYTIQGG